MSTHAVTNSWHSSRCWAHAARLPECERAQSHVSCSQSGSAEAAGSFHSAKCADWGFVSTFCLTENESRPTRLCIPDLFSLSSKNMMERGVCKYWVCSFFTNNKNNKTTPNVQQMRASHEELQPVTAPTLWVGISLLAFYDEVPGSGYVILPLMTLKGKNVVKNVGKGHILNNLLENFSPSLSHTHSHTYSRIPMSSSDKPQTRLFFHQRFHISPAKFPTVHVK